MIEARAIEQLADEIARLFAPQRIIVFGLTPAESLLKIPTWICWLSCGAAGLAIVLPRASVWRSMFAFRWTSSPVLPSDSGNGLNWGIGFSKTLSNTEWCCMTLTTAEWVSKAEGGYDAACILRRSRLLNRRRGGSGGI